MKKINKTDWFMEGFSILETDGFSRITIDNLCLRLEVTKGSFYHHFKNTDGYIKSLMEYWLYENTVSFIQKAELGRSITEKQQVLNSLTVGASHKMEQSIRAWGYFNSTVKEYVTLVDKVRLEYLISLREEMGMKKRKAREIAMLEYATLIGIQQLFPDLSKREFTRLQKIYSHNI